MRSIAAPDAGRVGGERHPDTAERQRHHHRRDRPASAASSSPSTASRTGAARAPAPNDSWSTTRMNLRPDADAVVGAVGRRACAGPRRPGRRGRDAPQRPARLCTRSPIRISTSDGLQIGDRRAVGLHGDEIDRWAGGALARDLGLPRRQAIAGRTAASAANADGRPPRATTRTSSSQGPREPKRKSRWSPKDSTGRTERTRLPVEPEHQLADAAARIVGVARVGVGAGRLEDASRRCRGFGDRVEVDVSNTFSTSNRTSMFVRAADRRTLVDADVEALEPRRAAGAACAARSRRP